MRLLLSFLLAIPSLLLFAQKNVPDFSVSGYAAVATEKYPNGTTGGEGGREVTPATIEELQKYANSTEKLIIRIDRELKGPAIVKLKSDKTLIGVEDKAFLNQVNININTQSNIIIRNIRFTMKDVPVYLDVENRIVGTNVDPDCITIQADNKKVAPEDRITSHIWIDHCEFYNEDPYVMTDYDRYDGLVDMKNNCTYITFSWNYLHDHHKSCLIGSGKSDMFDRKITYHHNYFRNIKSRMPLCRFGKIHFFNNFVSECNDGTNARIKTELCIERNVYKDTKKPVFGKIEELCNANLIDNKFINCKYLPEGQKNSDANEAKPLSHVEEFGKTDFKPDYKYDHILTPVNSVVKVVKKWAGVGKI